MMEGYKVDGALAFETDGLIGNPATAAKLLEMRPASRGETSFALELVERDPALRSDPPARRLEYTFKIAFNLRRAVLREFCQSCV